MTASDQSVATFANKGFKKFIRDYKFDLEACQTYGTNFVSFQVGNPT